MLTGCSVELRLSSVPLAIEATIYSFFVVILFLIQNSREMWFISAPGSISIRALTPAALAFVMSRLVSAGSRGSGVLTYVFLGTALLVLIV